MTETKRMSVTQALFFIPISDWLSSVEWWPLYSFYLSTTSVWNPSIHQPLALRWVPPGCTEFWQYTRRRGKHRFSYEKFPGVLVYLCVRVSRLEIGTAGMMCLAETPAVWLQVLLNTTLNLISDSSAILFTFTTKWITNCSFILSRPVQTEFIYV